LLALVDLLKKLRHIFLGEVGRLRHRRKNSGGSAGRASPDGHLNGRTVWELWIVFEHDRPVLDDAWVGVCGLVVWGRDHGFIIDRSCDL
jgi:hypothetical protein